MNCKEDCACAKNTYMPNQMIMCMKCQHSVHQEDIDFDETEEYDKFICECCLEKKRFKEKIKSIGFGTVPGGYKSSN